MRGGKRERETQRDREREKERERERERAYARVGEREPSGSSFYVFFFPLRLSDANWAQAGALFYLRSSLWFPDLALTFLCSIFVGFSLPDF